MAITAKDVNKLRQQTGAGMMDCKKALVEAEGDFEKAIDILRKKGQKVAAKRADRDANEGAVFISLSDDNSYAVLIELNCETDFVARNDDFQTLGETIANIALSNKPENLEALLDLNMEDGRPISGHLTDAIGKIGEKIGVSKFESISGEIVVPYIHPGARVGVAVAFNGANDNVETVGKDVAMQIAAMSPIAINEDGVAQNIIDRELEIGREQALAEGKPEQIIDKIAQGKLKKYFKENTLLHQDFVKDTSKSVGQYIKEELGGGATVVDFKRLQLGQS
ncbi:MAG: elongation factor Ts [Bacteroidetes bacterium]|nr:elongation factor Ts [Bacteroidota bacterium]